MTGSDARCIPEVRMQNCIKCAGATTFMTGSTVVLAVTCMWSGIIMTCKRTVHCTKNEVAAQCNHHC